MSEVLTVEQVVTAVKARRDAERAVFDRAYHKTHLACWGVNSPSQKAIVRELKADFMALSATAQRAIFRELWAREVFDLRMVVCNFLPQFERAGLRESDWAMAVTFAGSATGWAELDSLAAMLVGPLVEQWPDALYPKLSALAKHKTMWLRRLSVIGHLRPFRRGVGRWDVLEPTIVALMHEAEFFIRKAIGWQLREIADRDAACVIKFVEQHATALSGLSFREATRKLPAKDKARLKALRERA